VARQASTVGAVHNGKKKAIRVVVEVIPHIRIQEGKILGGDKVGLTLYGEGRGAR